MTASTKPQADLKGGELRLAAGVRVAALPARFLPALHESLLEQFADHAQDVLYRTGYEWSLEEMSRLSQQLRAELRQSGDLWQMDAKFILDTWWSGFAEAGWGRGRFDVASLSRGLAVAELHGSAVAAALGNSDQPVCHLYAGLFAAALSFYERSERHATEVQCSAMGGGICRFVIATGAEVDSAETWRQQGITADEIVRRLR